MTQKPAEMNAAQRHDPKMRAAECAADGLVWHSPWEAPLRIEGLGWKLDGNIYRRMPFDPSLPKAVDDLAWHTSGVKVRFRTDSKRIVVRVKLRGAHSMDHMPATGQCGFDAYLGDGGSAMYAGTTRFDRSVASYQAPLCDFPTAAMRTATIHFPLYQGVEALSIGLDEGACVETPPPRAWQRPVVVYGTSITQGGCASRPGMSYPNILSRRLDCEFINLGFSGNGRGEPEVAQVIATLPAPALFISDYEANCAGRLHETLPTFLGILRQAWPRTPMLVVSKVPYAREMFNEEVRAQRLERRDFQRALVDELREAGDTAVAFFDGGDLLGGNFTECAVDGVHQTDLGFLRMADSLEAVVRGMLQKSIDF
ncbi:MAG: SGNH/GDSL hydrolase family protein [Kiritimatiellia bacterium]